jgi:disulfide bond formation protein DsbB
MSTTARSSGTATLSSPAGIDPRGPRFVATLTTLVLALALVLAPGPSTVALLAVQAVVFGIGAGAGIQHTPYSWLFRTFLRPRLGPPAELEDPAPPRFAQSVGLFFAVVALAGYLAGVDLLGAVATGFALAAAFLNAAFGFCLGCELYLLGRRALN